MGTLARNGLKFLVLFLVLLFERDIPIYQHSTQLNGQITFQLAFIFSTSTIKTLEQGVKYVQN